jgi:DNA-binding transcriptional ArsR family regulator
MPRAKTEAFPESIVALADFAKALAHPARIQILTFLETHGPCPCMNIVAHIPLSQPSVSRHIAALSEAGLLNEKPKGNAIMYSLCKDRIQTFCETFSMTLKPSSAPKISSSKKKSAANCSLSQ